MRGTILPSLPPIADDFVVTVCAACKFRFCLLERKRCDARKNGDPGTLRFTVAELRASGSQEHYSYWRSQPGDDLEMPKCIEDVKDLAAHFRDRPDNESFAKVGMIPADTFAGYLTEQLGLDYEQCRDALKDVWPEASESIERVRLELHAETMERPLMEKR